jgi:hypothetical protein
MLSNATWETLNKSTGSTTGVVALRLHPESKLNIFAALDRTTGHRFLLLKSNRADVNPLRPLPSGRGFHVQFIITASDTEGINCLQMELSDRAYGDVFDVIGNDVLKNILKTTDEKTAFETFIARIDEWQHFLDQLPGDGLSEQAQQGLFAELWFFWKFLIPEIGTAKTVRAWGGPKALAKDFQLSGVAFEIKASSAKQHSRFTINSEMQLDIHGTGKLILYCLLLERVLADGTSLNELIAALRTELRSDPDAAILFSELLLQSGYADSDANYYTTCFAIRSQHFFDVKNDFPRIIESDLRPGVGDVRYSILYSECERYAITETEARSLIKN